MDPVPTDSTILLERFADRCAAIGMQVPLLWFLELHRPLAGVLPNLMIMFEPFLAILFGPQHIKAFREALSEPAAVEKLCQLLQRPPTAAGGKA